MNVWLLHTEKMNAVRKGVMPKYVPFRLVPILIKMLNNMYVVTCERSIIFICIFMLASITFSEVGLLLMWYLKKVKTD